MDIRRLKWVETKSWDTLQEVIKVWNTGNLEELLSFTGKWCTDVGCVAS